MPSPGDARLALLLLRSGRLRLVLVVLALALGVATVCAVDILNRAILRAFVEVVDAMAGRAALQVSAGGAGLFREGLVHRVGRVPGVAAAVPVMSATTFAAGHPEPLTVYGVDLLSEEPARAYGVPLPSPTADERRTGTPESRAVILPHALAARLGLGVGDALELETPTGRHRYRVRDLVALEGMSRSVGDDFAVVHLADAQLDFGRLRLVNRGDVVLDPGADLERVRAAIAAIVPAGLEVTTPLQRRMDLQRVMRSLRVILWGVAVVAVLLSVLVAFDAIATHFEAQAWQAGVLRAVGLRTAVVWRALLHQGVLLGGAAVLLGIPAGIALGRALVPLVAATAAVHYKITAPPAVASLSPWSVVTAAVIGLAAAVTAAALPAWRAARVPIVTTVGLRGREAGGLADRPAWLPRAVVLVALLGATAGAEHSAAAGLVATGLMLAAAALAARPLLGVLVLPLQRALDRLSGPSAPFACAGVAQGLRRTALAVAVLAVGIASVVWMRTVTVSFEHSLVHALGGSLRADLIVAATRIVSGWVPAPMAPDVLDELRRVPGVRQLAANRLADWTFRDASIAVNAFDAAYFTADAFEKPPLLGTHAPDAWARVGRGEAVVVSTSFLLNFGVRVGDRIELATPGGPLHLPVVGATLAFVSPGGTIEMSRELYERQWRDPLVNRIWVRTDPGAVLAAVRDDIAARLGPSHGLRAVSAADMRDHLVAQARRAFAPMAVVEVVLLVVALLSVGDTLAASVLRRLREIGTLRALGVRRAPVVRIVLVEALLIGALGLALGAVAGTLVGALWVQRTLPHLLGWLLAFEFPWARGGLVVLATIAVCLVAAILPARRAARLEPAMALRYE
jgi:putative ABC transport system permease protein